MFIHCRQSAQYGRYATCRWALRIAKTRHARDCAPSLLDDTRGSGDFIAGTLALTIIFRGPTGPDERRHRFIAPLNFSISSWWYARG
jgi:hypothetical protein